MEGKSLIFMALYSKSLMSRVGSHTFEKAVNVVDNGGNFNDNLEKWGRDRL